MQTEVGSEEKARLIELAAEINSSIMQYLAGKEEYKEVVGEIIKKMIIIILASMPKLDARNFRPEPDDRLGACGKYLDALNARIIIINNRINRLVSESYVQFMNCEYVKQQIDSEKNKINKLIGESYAQFMTCDCEYVKQQIDSEQRENFCSIFLQLFPSAERNVIQEFINSTSIIDLSSEYFTLMWYRAIPVTIIGMTIIFVSKYCGNEMSSSDYGNTSIVNIHSEALYIIVQMHERYSENKQVTGLYYVALALVGKLVDHEHNEDSRTATDVLFKMWMYISVIRHDLDTNCDTQDTRDEDGILKYLCDSIHFFRAFVFCTLNKNFPEEFAKQYLGDRRDYEGVIKQAEDFAENIYSKAAPFMMTRKGIEDRQQRADDRIVFEPSDSSDELDGGNELM
jgi:hypothetical protein